MGAVASTGFGFLGSGWDGTHLRARSLSAQPGISGVTAGLACGALRNGFAERAGCLASDNSWVPTCGAGRDFKLGVSD